MERKFEAASCISRKNKNRSGESSRLETGEPIFCVKIPTLGLEQEGSLEDAIKYLNRDFDAYCKNL